MTVRTSGIALILTVCAASLHAAETRNIDKTLPLSASGSITLDVHNGLIEIRTWDRPDVDVHVRIEPRDSSGAARARARETTVDIDGTSDRVAIKLRDLDSWASLSRWMLWSDWYDSPQIHYAITAPRTARLRIHDHNAKADIRDVSAPVELSTHNGSVWIANLNGPLDLRPHNGDAHVDFASFTHASRVASHDGSVELTLPASSRFELNAVGHRMSTQSDFAVTRRASDFGRHRVQGKVNGGGPELTLSSHNGSIRLRSK